MIDLAQFASRPADDQGASRSHPLAHAAKWIAADLLSTLAFVGFYALFHSVTAAMALGIAAGVLQIAYLKVRRRRVDAMQWMSLALVVVFGAASMATHDIRFVMLKPTLIYAAIGATMLKRGWMARYMPPIVLARSDDLVVVFGYLWAAAMFGSAALNAAFASTGNLAAWTGFITVFPIASKVSLILIQYAATRAVTVARVRRATFAAA